MCLPNFERFEQVSEDSPIIGYRNWLLTIKNPISLKSINQNYVWDKVIEGPHEVLNSDSGIYSYSNNYNYNYNKYKYNNNNYNYNYNYNNIGGIINQYGKVAIHKSGYRSEYAKINKLFTIRKFDMEGPKEFSDWIVKFNQLIINLASKYECSTINWQDFIESIKG